MRLKTHSLHPFKGGLFLVKRPGDSTEVPGPPFPFHVWTQYGSLLPHTLLSALTYLGAQGPKEPFETTPGRRCCHFHPSPSRLFPGSRHYEAQMSALRGQRRGAVLGAAFDLHFLWAVVTLLPRRAPQNTDYKYHSTTSKGSKSKQRSQAVTPVRCKGRAGLLSITQHLGSHRHDTRKLLIK